MVGPDWPRVHVTEFDTSPVASLKNGRERIGVRAWGRRNPSTSGLIHPALRARFSRKRGTLGRRGPERGRQVDGGEPEVVDLEVDAPRGPNVPVDFFLSLSPP